MGKGRGEIDDVIGELEALLKNPDVGAELADAGVNISLALVMVDGVHAYLRGEKAKAVEELETATEEVRSRLAADGGGRRPS